MSPYQQLILDAEQLCGCSAGDSPAMILGAVGQRLVQEREDHAVRVAELERALRGLQPTLNGCFQSVSVLAARKAVRAALAGKEVAR